MSIATEIQRIQTAKAGIKTALEGKGVTVPSTTKIDGYPSLVESIPSGGSRTGTGPYIKNPINGLVQIDFTKGNFTYDYEIDGDVNAFETWYFNPSSNGMSSESFSNKFYVAICGVNYVSVAKIGTKIRLTLTPRFPDDEGSGTAQYSFIGRIAFTNKSDGVGQTISCGDTFLGIVTTYVPAPCFVKGTQITLADGIKKNVEDITYDDDIIVWDFDNGKLTTSKAIWITRGGLKTDSYIKATLSNETIMKLCGPKSHRLFNVERGEFVYAIDMVGKHTIDKDGNVVEVVSCERVEEPVEYYNIITDYHMNLYANDILTSCRYSNLYPIVDMKYVKEEREIVPYEMFDSRVVSMEYYDGLRLGEQTIPIEETNKYCDRLKYYDTRI